MNPPMETRERQYRPGERVPGTEYVVVRLEAEGGHGALYLVRHHFLEKKIQMLKTLRSIEPSADLIERLKREAQMLAAMDHPHIVSVTSGGLTDEKQPRPYFVMERLKGRSLAQIVPEAPEGVGVDAALKVTIEVCDALEYVHVRHGVVHRDIKPDNIFLQVTPRNGSVTKILDFGVAHIMDLEKRYTKNNLFLGTPRYASPEQIMGDKPTPQTDLYAVGLLLYELLLGYGPFDEAKNFAAVATAHVQHEPPGFPKTRRFPPGLEDLVMSLLRKKAEERPKSAEWLATQLRQIKRIAEVAEHDQSQDLNQTDMSPVQNILTGHRAHLTEAGAPPDVESTPTLTDPARQTSPESPLGYRSTMRVVVPDAPSASPRGGVDRAAPTRSLHVDISDARRSSSDTEELPGARVWTPSEPPRPQGPASLATEGAGVRARQGATSTAAAVELSRETAPTARSQRGLVAGLAVALVAAVATAGFLAVRTPARSDVASAAPAPTAVSAASVDPSPGPSTPSIATPPSPSAMAATTSTAASLPASSPTATAAPTPSAPSVPTSAAPTPPATSTKPAPRLARPATAPAPLRVPASGL